MCSVLRFVLLSCCLKRKGYYFLGVPSNHIICLCLSVPLPGRLVCTACFERRINSTIVSCIPNCQFGRKQKENKSHKCSKMPVVLVAHGENSYILLLSELLIRDLSKWTSYENRYPSLEINRIFASDGSCSIAQIVFADGQVRNVAFTESGSTVTACFIVLLWQNILNSFSIHPCK